jgi:prolyl oligopeptidase
MPHARFLLLPLAAAAMSASAQPLSYPATERQDVVEQQFGIAVADPYRWLEDDVRTSPKVRQWVTEQNKVTEAYLSALPGRDAFRTRIKSLFAFERFSVPEKKGGRYFYTRNSGLQNQNVLFVRDRLDGAPRMLIDPNTWSSDGATALAEWQASEDGKHLLYSIQEGGTDWRIVRVLDVDSGKLLADEVKWVKYSNLDWARDGSGFFYSRFAEPKAGQQFQSTTEGQQVWFHRLGTGQSDDRLVFEQKDRPTLGNTAQVSDDGKWLIVSSSQGTDARYEITLIDLGRPGAAPRRFVTGLENDWRYLG